MIRLLDDMPPGVLGLEAVDNYEGEAVWEHLKLGARHRRRSSGSPS